MVEEAVRHYVLAIDCDPKFPDPWSNLGNLLKCQGQPEVTPNPFCTPTPSTPITV